MGVAPGVRVASIRVAEMPGNMCYAESTICGLMFASSRGIDIANLSYFTDPWAYNCPDDLDQAAILEGVTRAQQYAESQGVLSVAAANNFGQDLANKTVDTYSPNDSSPVSRNITTACKQLPAELPGVVTVSAIESSNQKSVWSKYGHDKIHVTAPGTGVYSTVPGGGYEEHMGTSMAAPHVSGVAALILSRSPGMSVADLRTALGTQADNLPCHDQCTGTTEKNSYFGEGRVNAYRAVGGQN
nr:S8 family serine peptidase [Streptomyces sp. 3211]